MSEFNSGVGKLDHRYHVGVVGSGHGFVIEIPGYAEFRWPRKRIER